MYTNINQIYVANAKAGYHFFEAETLNFFGSKVYPKIYGGRFFITSEKRPRSNDPRRFTVREAKDDGSVVSASCFQQFATKRQAERFIDVYLNAVVENPAAEQ